VKLTSATLDTDTTVHTLYGDQMGARKSYNPKNKGKKSYQPILIQHALEQSADG
jgi:membrane carboxypeptidase/penicillin-binding protein